jgi:SnoaL-like domain
VLVGAAGHAVPMIERYSAEAVLRKLWERIDAQDWDRMADLLDHKFQAHLLHTDERFTADGFVRFNRDYPGHWRAAVEDLVAAGDRAVSRTRVSDDRETYHVASFATVQDGRISELVEVWSESGVAPPADRRPVGKE